MQKIKNSGLFLVDYGLMEGKEENFSPAPATTQESFLKKPAYQKAVETHVAGKTVTPKEQEPEWKKFGFESQQELDIMKDVKAQGGTAQDGQEILEQYRAKQTPIVEPQEEEISGLDIGVKTGEAIAGAGEFLKFEAEEDDGKITSIAKFFGNLPGDTLQLAGDLIGVASDPVGTVKSVEQFAGSMIETGLNKTFGQDTFTSDEKRLISESVSAELKKISDDPSILRDMVVENPTDTLFSFVGGVGAAKNVAKSKNMTGLVSKLEKVEQTMNPINIQKQAVTGAGKVAGPVVKLPGEITKTLTAKTSGLNPETLTQLFKNPDLVKSGLTREGTANKVVSAIDTRVDEVSELGKAYEGVRKGEVITNSDELFSPFQKTFSSFDKKELTKSDLKTIDDASFYINKYKGDITDSNLIALRQQLDSIKYDDSGNLRKLSKNGNRVVTELRSTVDGIAKEKINGLKELDAQFSTEIKELGQLKKMVMDRNGDIKDNYIQTIANLTGKGKEVKLDRIKKLIPEIEDEINSLKALEDVEFAKGNKVGTYFQTATLGGGLGGAAFLGNPLLGIGSMLITSPTVVSNLVRSAGYSTKFVASITEKIKNGIKLSKEEAEVVGKTVQEQINENAIAGKEVPNTAPQGQQ